MSQLNTTNQMIREFEQVLRQRCFACDRPMNSQHLVTCSDEQTVYVGPECFKKISKAADGWQPAKGGPRLYKIEGQR